jgi:hypothetical protein
MSSAFTLPKWLATLLPDFSRCAENALLCGVQALLHAFTTNLSQLARQVPRESSARTARQFLSRALASAGDSRLVFSRLAAQLPRLLPRARRVLLLIDFTYLQHDWAVLQVSVPWQNRALPVYRAVIRRKQGQQKGAEAALLREALAWLGLHLPGWRGRYVLVMDRGLPSHAVIESCRHQGWRFVFRIREEWKVTLPDFCAPLGELALRPKAVGPRPQGYGEVWFGQWQKGPNTKSLAHLVTFHGPGFQEPWFLATSERKPTRAVAIYRERMKIEAEFRDLKGPWGLDELAQWHHCHRVEQFLTWVAVYEWWLAELWSRFRLSEWQPKFRVYGKLSWIRITRLWLDLRRRLVGQLRDEAL